MTTKRDDYLREASADDAIIERTREQTEHVRNLQRRDALEQSTDAAEAIIDSYGLHPVHKARAFRELGGRMIERAKDQERENTEHGVPD